MSNIPNRPIWSNANDALPQNIQSATDPVVDSWDIDLNELKPSAINTPSPASVAQWLKTTNDEDKVPPLKLVAISFWQATPTEYQGGAEYEDSEWESETVTISDVTRLKASCTQVFDGGEATESGSNTLSLKAVKVSGSSNSVKITVPEGQTHYQVVWQWVTQYALMAQTDDPLAPTSKPFYYDHPYWDIGGNNYGYSVGFQDWVTIGGQVNAESYNFYENTGDPVPEG